MRDISGYFDWAATAPTDNDIIQESQDIAADFFANPSSQHKKGLEAKQKLSQARQTVANTLAVPIETIFFTSGGTEANHIPLLSLLRRPAKGSVVISAIEHPSIREQAEMLKHCGWKIIPAEVDTRGIVTAQAVEKALAGDTVLVCVMAVNNETGAIQPIYEIADMLFRHATQSGKRRVKLHVDCVQAAGKIPFALNHKGIDSAAFSAHKIGGPRGIGILYLSQKIDPFLRGGGQESGIRSGTENLYGAWAVAKCMEKYFIPCKNDKTPADSPQAVRYNAQTKATQKFMEQILATNKCKIIPEQRTSPSESGNFSPWIVQAAFDGIPGEAMVRSLSERGFYISTGSACSAKKLNRPVLEAMGIPKEDMTNAVRFSFGHRTEERDMERLVEVIKEVLVSLV